MRAWYLSVSDARTRTSPIPPGAEIKKNKIRFPLPSSRKGGARLRGSEVQKFPRVLSAESSSTLQHTTRACSRSSRHVSAVAVSPSKSFGLTLRGSHSSVCTLKNLSQRDGCFRSHGGRAPGCQQRRPSSELQIRRQPRARRIRPC